MSDNNNTSASSPAAQPAEANPLAGGCPVAHVKSPSANSAAAAADGHSGVHVNKLHAGCPVAIPPGTKSTHGMNSEPSASSAHRSAASSSSPHHPFQYAKAQTHEGLDEDGEETPSNFIPAAGRGNSDDGKQWLNPSANQLYRALMRKDKPIEAGDAKAVASVHVAVTDNTWNCILEYEKLHAKSCPNPTLARFQGMDGIYSFKAQMMMRFLGMRPFDRHDWYVNRCGKEVKYVIDYYSFEIPDPHTGETSIDYFIDARPAPTVGGLFDRARIAFGKWRRGEKIW